MMDKGKKVFVGVSGGVDSSVALYLLKKAGFDVTGVFIRTWQPDWIECTWREERRDAIRVCAHLGVPFLECDLEERYKKDVADYMVSEYKKGRTPNPDVMCNKEVKFGGFLDFAIKHGADFIATGHYAQVIQNNGVFELHKSVDAEKDQSYFLWTLSQKELKHVLFPIGHLTKKEVRKIAEKAKLHTATKKDSQGICFLGKIPMKDFLSHFIEEKEGKVLNEKGEEIGSHPGALFFTLGERHGFLITKKGPDDKPYYVIKKDIEKNTLIVSNDPLTAADVVEMANQSIGIESLHFISDKATEGHIYQVRSRYRQKTVSAYINQFNNEAEVALIDAKLIAPSGQSLVIYDGTRCVGGGIVK